MAAALEPFEPFERSTAFNKLRELMNGDAPPLALIGAGASRNSGYPDWNGLMDELREMAGQSAKIPQRQELLKGDPSWEAEVHLKSIPKKAFYEFIENRFSRPPQVAEPHLQIARMPFRHFLTTNYDPCIELSLDRANKTYRTVNWDADDVLSDFLINLASPSSKRSILYLHGRYDRPKYAIMTESSYVKRYVKNDDARRKLLAIFMTHPVVFIGFSMNDPDLANLMREVTARLQTETPCHYALMAYGSEPEREVYRERMRGKFGVEPVFYYNNGGRDKHVNLGLLLEALSFADDGAEPADLRASTSRKAAARQIAIEPSAAPPRDPNDPEKNQWGGLAEQSGFRLKVVKRGGSKRDGYLTLDLVVESRSKTRPLDGTVTFHLHPTFQPSVYAVKAKGEKAVLDGCSAYGAFTVGASLDNTGVRLELDLALQPNLPEWFRRL